MAVEVSGALYVVCIGEALVVLVASHSLGLLPLLGVLAAPALAALMLVLTSFAVPGILLPGHLAAPLNFTLPTVYCSFLYLAVDLGPGSEPEILRLRDVMEWAMVWSNPAILICLLGAQVGFLSLLARQAGKQEPR